MIQSKQKTVNKSYVFDECQLALLVATAIINYNITVYNKKGRKNMFSENLKTLRKNKGFSQEQLSVRLNVVRHGPVIIGLN